MRRVCCWMVLLLGMLARRGYAQTGVYLDFSAAKLSAGTGDWMYGPTVGLYHSVGYGLVSAGLDARGTFLTRDGAHLYSGLVGPRLALTPHVLPFKPYVEGLVGVGNYGTGAVGGNATSTNFEYQLLGGVDMTILPRIDWRVVEFSYGGLSVLNGSYNPKTLSTGIVLRLP